MTKEEYNTKIDKLNNEHYNKVRQVDFEYAKERTIANVGDIVVSNTGISLEVTGFMLNHKYYGNMPYLSYKGYILTKKGTRRKNLEMTQLVPSQIVSVNGKEIHYEQDLILKN